MNASVKIVVAERRSVVTVPLEAVARNGEAPRVTVVDATGHATRRRVSVGLADNKMIEITRGLRPGERVELRGA
jgi:multidrug efflux pump subunit AcrA (membrane-fusion protein)